MLGDQFAELLKRNEIFTLEDKMLHGHWYDDDPRAQLRAIMSYLAHRTTQSGYRGCPFINYCAEFPDASHPGHQVVEANKREMRRRLLGMAEKLGVARPKQLADGLLLLVEGTYAISQTLGGGGRDRAARSSRLPKRWSRRNGRRIDAEPCTWKPSLLTGFPKPADLPVEFFGKYAALSGTCPAFPHPIVSLICRSER
jgi:hypothetical protein